MELRGDFFKGDGWGGFYNERRDPRGSHDPVVLLYIDVKMSKWNVLPKKHFHLSVSGPVGHIGALDVLKWMAVTRTVISHTGVVTRPRFVAFSPRGHRDCSL